MGPRVWTKALIQDLDINLLDFVTLEGMDLNYDMVRGPCPGKKLTTKKIEQPSAGGAR